MLIKEPVSMFVLFAKMFSITAKNLEKEFGEKGLKVLEDSVKEFGYQTTYGKNKIHQDFTRCVFAKTWMDANEEKYGRIYCENIDPAIAAGYNQNMECIHDAIMYKDGHCTFCFRMKNV